MALIAPLRMASPTARVQASLTAGAAGAAALLQQYDRPGPRYTSYPTAAEFTDQFDEHAYRERLGQAAGEASEPLSLYVHLPFCEARCTYCGCMTIITKKREVAARYLGYLEREIAMLGAELKDRRRLVQYHWGGGTPTYLSASQIEQLHASVAKHFEIDPAGEIAIEVDPRVTTREQLGVLHALGFNRLSMGVQDFTPEVQAAIGRRQSAALTRDLYDAARAIGFTSINLDLIYGLPLQTTDTFNKTLSTVVAMRPDRIAVYSYAHVPWLRPHQRAIDPADLPERTAKFELIGAAIDAFGEAGYDAIGMDHFALPTDDLAIAARERRLHRNFMGYTTRRAGDMVGVGVSAIGDLQGAFAQNVKKLSTYYDALDAGRFPIDRGYALSADDVLRRHVITELMCNFYVNRAETSRRFDVDFDAYFNRELSALAAPAGPVADGFLRIEGNSLEVTDRGRLFVRNICMEFDKYLPAHAGQPAFSRTI